MNIPWNPLHWCLILLLTCLFVNGVPDDLNSLLYSRIAINIWDESKWSPHVLSSNCIKSLQRIQRSQTSLFHRFLDSSAALPAGILDGTVSSFGNYDQCLEISPSDQDFNGKYCLAKLRFKEGLESVSSTSLFRESLKAFPLIVATCVPQGCGDNDVRVLFEASLATSVLRLLPDPIFCDTKESTGFLSRLSFPSFISL